MTRNCIVYFCISEIVDLSHAWSPVVFSQNMGFTIVDAIWIYPVH